MPIHRRTALSYAATGFLGLACRQGYSAPLRKLRNTQKRCIVLWMAGGPSQFETFDPKPGEVTGGPTQAITTEVPGLSISEHLPLVAKQAEHLNVVRSLSSQEGEHQRATYLMHTGFSPIAAFPRPELGSLVAHQQEAVDHLPGFVTLGGESGARIGNAYLDEQFAAFEIGDPRQTLELLNKLKRSRGRFDLLNKLSGEFDQRHQQALVQERKATLERVEGLLDSRLTEILNLETDKEDLERYGESDFGRNLLLARKLIESGVSCVEVQLGGWDTHLQNFRQVSQLCRTLDQPWARLIQDLKERELWEDTLVLWMGDFGRTPKINGNQGRDHFPGISNAVLAGGGLSGGQVIGKTNAMGTRIEEAKVSTADLFATILARFGIEPDEEFTTTFGSPTEATDAGKIIADLQA